MMITTLLPSIGASFNENIQNVDITGYESYIFGVGFVRIHGFTHVIKGFVLFGINDGQAISTEFINIKYNDVKEIFVGYFTPFTFLMLYDPA